MQDQSTAKRASRAAAWRSDGFERAPAYTQTPDELFDVIAPQISEAELRVLLYIVRHTFGWKKDADTISLKQMVSGITRHDGSQHDLGTGMAKSSVVRGIQGLIRRGLIEAEHRSHPERGDEPTTYHLRFRGGVAQSDTGGSAKLPAGVAQSDTQEITRQEGAAVRPGDWQNVLQALAPQMKAAMYETYLAPLQPRVWTTERLELAAPAALFPVLPRFRPLIAKAVRATTQERPTITFVPRS